MINQDSVKKVCEEWLEGKDYFLCHGYLRGEKGSELIIREMLAAKPHGAMALNLKAAMEMNPVAGIRDKLKKPEDCPEGLVGDVHEAGLRLCLRAADTPEVMKKMIDMGLDYQPSNKVFGL